ncbi:hypothetical protein [Vitreoscilla filiformis]|nr:hypothetical protein [Vitreoscilla filiformis]
MYTTSARYTPAPNSKRASVLSVLRQAGKPLYSCELIARMIELGSPINVHQLACLFRPLLAAKLVYQIEPEPKSVWVAADAPVQTRPVCLLTHEGSVLDKALTFLMGCPDLTSSLARIHTAIGHSRHDVQRELTRACAKGCALHSSGMWQLVPDRWLSSNVKTRAAAAAVAAPLRSVPPSDFRSTMTLDETDEPPFVHRVIPSWFWQAKVPIRAVRSVFHLGGL